MATADIRAKRIELEYQSVRGVQDDIPDKVDGFEAAVVGLSRAVSENHEMLQAIIKHPDLIYKQPMRFIKNEAPME